MKPPTPEEIRAGEARAFVMDWPAGGAVSAGCPEEGSSGGCSFCGWAEGEDENGRYMREFFVQEDSGDVCCRLCWKKYSGEVQAWHLK